MHQIEKILQRNPNLTADELAKATGLTKGRVYQVLSEKGLKAKTLRETFVKGSSTPASQNKVFADGSAMTSSFRGDITEMTVARDLLLRGIHVFRSVTANAPCDMIACSNGRLCRVEVRTGGVGGNGEFYFNRSSEHKRDAIAVALFGQDEVQYYTKPGFEWIYEVPEDLR